MSYTLGMMGPISLADFRDHLFPGQWRDDLPKGLGGSPVNLLSRELLRRGQRLVIFTLDTAVQDEVVLEGENLRICIGPYRPRAKHRALDFFASERKYLLQAIKRERPDILHAQWTYEYALAAQASGLPHVITAHDAPIAILRLMFDPYRIVRTLMAYRVLLRARRVVSVSPYVAEHLNRYMLYRGSVEVIPNGMPESLFDSPVIDRPVDQPITFATILSGWAGLKNGQVAIEAFARVRRSYPEARLIMFGSGHGPEEEAKYYAKEHGIESGIEFVGQIPYAQVMARLAPEVDVLVHPSLEESFGMIFIEAMALRIPTIGGQLSGAVPWVLNHGKAGMLVDVKDTEALANAMLHLAINRDERCALGQRGRDFAEAKFHIRVIADAYENNYHDLLAHRA